MIHKETNVTTKLKVIISLLYAQFSNTGVIESAIKAMDYAGKKHLRLRGNITGTGVVMGNVLILDVNIPLNTSNSIRGVATHYDAFNAEVVNYLTNGIYHQADGKTYGGFGKLNVGYVSSQAVRETTYTVRVKTIESASTVRNALANVGEVQDVRDEVGRYM